MVAASPKWQRRVPRRAGPLARRGTLSVEHDLVERSEDILREVRPWNLACREAPVDGGYLVSGS
jgi:hypothetical protein